MELGGVAWDENVGESVVVYFVEGEFGVLVVAFGGSPSSDVVVAAEVTVFAVGSQLDVVKAAVAVVLDSEGRRSDVEADDVVAELDVPDAVLIVVVIATVEAGREDRLVACDSSTAFPVKHGSARRARRGVARGGGGDENKELGF